VRGAALLVAIAGFSACDFGAAFDRYCQDNPSCAGPDASQAVRPLKSCERPEDCALGTEVCHPRGKVCVRSCASSADCPAGEDSCQEIAGGHPGAPPLKICACSSAQSCAHANPETTCSPVDNVCELLCASASDCASFAPARVCDQANGLCLLEAGCTSNVDCTSAVQPRCDPSGICSRCMSPFDCSSRTDGLTDCDQRSGACVAPLTCDPTNPTPGASGGPDACRYGQVCVSSTCAPVQNGNCLGAVQAQWDQRKKGPVIVSATGAVFATSDMATQCPSGGRMLTASVVFYAPLQLTCDPLAPWSCAVFVSANGLGAGGGQFAASFVQGAPPSGAVCGALTAGLCDVSGSDFAGWSVALADASGSTGNLMCLQ